MLTEYLATSDFLDSEEFSSIPDINYTHSDLTIKASKLENHSKHKPLDCNFNQKVLCINCEEHISVCDIEHHSEMCFKPSYEVLEQEKQQDLEKIRYNLDQYLKIFKSRSESIFTTKRQKDFFISMVNLLSDLLADKTKLEFTIKSIENLKKNYSRELKVDNYFEKLDLLLKSYVNLIDKKSEKNSSASMKILENNLASSNLYRSGSQIFNKGVPWSLPVSPRYSEDQGFNGRNKFHALSEINLAKFLGKKPNADSCIDEKVNYFSKMCNLRKNNTNRNLCKRLSNYKMFEDAVKKNVPIEKWEKYIDKCFKYPNPLLFENIKRESSFASKKQYFESIIEEI